MSEEMLSLNWSQTFLKNEGWQQLNTDNTRL
jgi:hypothetical protein